MPRASPPHKPVEQDPGRRAPPRDVPAGCRAAERLSACARSRSSAVGRPTPSIRCEHPCQPPDAELTFIVGARHGGTLPAWREPEELLALALAGGGRACRRRAVARRSARGCAGRAAPRVALPRRCRRSTSPPRWCASARPRASRSTTWWPAVARYIAEHGLYREAVGRRLMRSRARSSPELVGEIARYAADKKAIDVVELDLRGVLGYTDYFVICSGNTDRQAKAIHDGILEGLKHEHGIAAAPRRGLRRRGLDPDGLPRRGRPHLHARDARVLPPRAALGRGAGARADSA